MVAVSKYNRSDYKVESNFEYEQKRTKTSKSRVHKWSYNYSEDCWCPALHVIERDCSLISLMRPHTIFGTETSQNKRRCCRASQMIPWRWEWLEEGPINFWLYVYIRYGMSFKKLSCQQADENRSGTTIGRWEGCRPRMTKWARQRKFLLLRFEGIRSGRYDAMQTLHHPRIKGMEPNKFKVELGGPRW